jgi:hypothetical protein
VLGALSLAALLCSAATASAAQALDQSQTSGSPVLGIGPNQVLAQTYTAGRSGGLTQVDLNISAFAGNPGPLVIDIEGTQAAAGVGDGVQPNGTVLGSASYDGPTASWPSDGFVSVAISPSARQTAGTQYAIVLSAPDAADVGGDGPFYLWASTTTKTTGMAAIFENGEDCGGWCTDDPAAAAFAFRTWVTPSPVTSIALTPASPNGTGGWYTEPVAISVSATDASDTRCVLDPAVPPAAFSGFADSCTYAAPGATVSSEGSNTVYAASAGPGGTESSVASASFKIDTTPPQVSFAGAGAYTVDQTVDVTCSASDPAPTDGPGPASGVAGTPCASPLASGPASGFALGSHTVSVTASDNAGNVTKTSRSFTVAVTPKSLCSLEGEFVSDSVDYRDLPAWGSQAAELFISAGCNLLTPLVATNRAALILLDYTINAEASEGWLTKAQAATLTKLASEL